MPRLGQRDPGISNTAVHHTCHHASASFTRALVEEMGGFFTRDSINTVYVFMSSDIPLHWNAADSSHAVEGGPSRVCLSSAYPGANCEWAQVGKGNIEFRKLRLTANRAPGEVWEWVLLVTTLSKQARWRRSRSAKRARRGWA